MKEIYIVFGVCDANNCGPYPIFSEQHSAFNTFEEAQIELGEILKESIEYAKKNELIDMEEDFKYTMHEDMLELTIGNDYEIYYIKKSQLKEV